MTYNPPLLGTDFLAGKEPGSRPGQKRKNLTTFHTGVCEVDDERMATSIVVYFLYKVMKVLKGSSRTISKSVLESKALVRGGLEARAQFSEIRQRSHEAIPI